MIGRMGGRFPTFAMLTADQEAKADQEQAAQQYSEIHDEIAKESIFFEEKLQLRPIILNNP